MANESYSTYPSRIDGYSALRLVSDGVSEIVASDHNSLRDAIIKIEQELGTEPSSTFATVSDRLDNIGDPQTVIAAHLADTVDAHDASAISVLDTDLFYSSTNVEAALDELATALLYKPNVIGEVKSSVPNTGVPSFVDGYGTKFLYNISDWSGEADDNEVAKTQPRPINGVNGIHILEVSSGTNNGVGVLSFTFASSSITWQAPGNATGTALVISGLATGDEGIVYSSNTTMALRFVRTSDALPTSNVYDEFEVYGMDCVSGIYSLLGTGFQTTDKITHAAISSTGVCRSQLVIAGKVYPADQGILVLQKKPRGTTDFYPIAALNLGNNFTEATRSTGQDAYVPALSGFDIITLYDRRPMLTSYTETDVNGSAIYSGYTIEYPNMQIAKYVIPLSNRLVPGGELTSPADETLAESNADIASFRVIHYRSGTDYNGDPASADIFSTYDVIGNTANNGDNNVRMSNVYVDKVAVRPGIETIYVEPQSGSESVLKTLSGIHYYNSASDLFDFKVLSNDNLFSSTYVRNDILRFSSNVFNFPHGTSAGKFGADIDVDEILDDGYVKFSASNLPTFTEKGIYMVSAAVNNGRQIYPAPNQFTSRAFITAKFYDPFGAGDGYDAYGNLADGIWRNKILVNTYSARSTNSQEYFTDENYRIGQAEEFLYHTLSGQFTWDDGYNFSENVDGYLVPWYDDENLPGSSLQCGAKFTNNEINICGLIYPQDDYTDYTIWPYQGFEASPLIDLEDYSTHTGDMYYQRLFSLDYAITKAQLRVVSGGNNLVAFADIASYNADRFGKIEIKIPGPGNDDLSTRWMDISKLFAAGKYDSDDGALGGVPTGTTGDFTIPFTFGEISNSSSGNLVAIRITYFGATAAQRVESKKRIITQLELLSQT